jgi:hypothetical protein
MRTSVAGLIWKMVVAAIGAAALVSLLLPSGPVHGQAAAYRAPRLPGTQNPDFNGIWQAFTTANWDIVDHPSGPGPAPLVVGAWGIQPPGRGIVEGNVIPYKPEALARKKANFDRRLKVDPQNLHEMGDPEAKCYLPGVPRAMYMPYPFQIVQAADQILMAFQYASANRTVYLKDHREAPVPSWMGWSNGRWDGDTLTVDVTAQNGQSWLDRAGDFAGENLRVTERYTALGPDHLQYEATLDDPMTFTRAWKIGFPLYRRKEPDIEVLELRCVPFVEEYMYGTLRKKTSR